MLAAVPYQCCPLCNGNGQTVADGFISSVYQTCKVCNGEMIIPMHIVDELGNNANLLLPADLLDEILAAIANYEEIIDGEWGCGRSVEQLIKDGRMPKLYNKLLAIKNGA